MDSPNSSKINSAAAAATLQKIYGGDGGLSVENKSTGGGWGPAAYTSGLQVSSTISQTERQHCRALLFGLELDCK